MPLTDPSEGDARYDLVSPRILVVCDDRLARAGLAVLLQDAGGHVVGRARTRDVAAAIAAHLPDVLLLDPPIGPDGVPMVDGLTDDIAPIPFVVVVDDAAAARMAAMSGAAGRIERDADGPELLAAAFAVGRGLDVTGAALRAVADHPVDSPGFEPLTARELEVLAHLAEGSSNREIGARLEISHHTVKAHVDSILAKLGAASRTQAVVSALRRGVIDL